MLIQGGDISSELRDGSSRGESIYGETFDDESFDVMHSEPGLLTSPSPSPSPNPNPNSNPNPNPNPSQAC